MTINGFVHSILDYPLIYEHLKNNNNTHNQSNIDKNTDIPTAIIY
jgi:hypothetical protein